MSTVTALAVGLLAVVAGFQVALALGAPWAAFAYGGRAAAPDGRLPAPWRVASGATVLVLAIATWCVHTRSQPATWAFTVLFALNTAGNLTGRHWVERWVMSTATAALSACFLILSLS